MSEVTIRINANYASPEKMKSYCEARALQYLVSKQEIGHVNKTPHFHIWMKSKYKHSTIRNTLKATFPEAVGNGGYSIARIKKDTATAQGYTIKQGCLLHSDNFSQEDVVSIGKSWISQKDLKDKNRKSKYARYYEIYSQNKEDYFKFVIEVVKEQLSKDLLPPAPALMSKYYHFCLFKDDIKNNYYSNIKEYYTHTILFS